MKNQIMKVKEKWNGNMCNYLFEFEVIEGFAGSITLKIESLSYESALEYAKNYLKIHYPSNKYELKGK